MSVFEVCYHRCGEVDDLLDCYRCCGDGMSSEPTPHSGPDHRQLNIPKGSTSQSFGGLLDFDLYGEDLMRRQDEGPSGPDEVSSSERGGREDGVQEEQDAVDEVAEDGDAVSESDSMQEMWMISGGYDDDEEEDAEMTSNGENEAPEIR